MDPERKVINAYFCFSFLWNFHQRIIYSLSGTSKQVGILAFLPRLGTTYYPHQI